MKFFKKHINNFYISLLSITIFALVAFVFISLIGEHFLIKEESETKIYFVDNISPGHKLVVEKFNQLYEGKIKVIPIDLPFEKFSTNERKELLVRYLRSKSDRIDIFSVDQIWTQRFAKFVEPLGNHFPVNKREKYLEAAIESCYFNDQLVAIPLYIDISIMYYNKEELQRRGKYASIKNELDNFITWERFIEIGKELKTGVNPYYIFPAADYEGLVCSYFELLESQNYKIFSGDSINITSRESIRSLQLLIDLVHKYKLSPPDVTAYKETEADLNFISKNGIFLRNWPGFYKWYRTFISDDNPEDKYGMAPLPHFTDSKPASIIGGWNLMISATSKKKTAALEFVKFLNSEEAQLIMYNNSGFLPVIKSLYESLSNNEDAKIKFFNDIFKTYVHRPYSEFYTRYSDVIAHYMHLAIKNNLSAYDVLKKAEQIINSNQIFIK
ncbi:MAG: extracellular solute-binding protein [Melioribacteraceae bacterium]|nr:extracellular solute-binding protein [Melioribacteraceae bacterium]